MKNSADQGGCYPQRPTNCFIIHSKYFLLLKGVLPLCCLFFCSPNMTQPCPQVFSVNGSIICSGLYFWRYWFNMAKFLSKFGQQQLVMVNYACGFNQSETGIYFEWIINKIYILVVCLCARYQGTGLANIIVCIFNNTSLMMMSLYVTLALNKQG